MAEENVYGDGEEGAREEESPAGDGEAEEALPDMPKGEDQADPEGDGETSAEAPAAGEDAGAMSEATAEEAPALDAAPAETAAAPDAAAEEPAALEAPASDEPSPEQAPEAAPEASPEVAPEAAPEAAPEVAPEAAPQVAPEVAQEPTAAAELQQAGSSSGAVEAPKSGGEAALMETQAVPEVAEVEPMRVQFVPSLPPNRGLTGVFQNKRTGKVYSAEQLCESVERLSLPVGFSTMQAMAQANEGLSAMPGWKEPEPKVLDQATLEDMLERLYKVKVAVEVPARPKCMKLKLVADSNGKLVETYEPVKEVTVKENIDYLCELYQRCLDNRKAAEQKLAEKYLQPLGKPRTG